MKVEPIFLGVFGGFSYVFNLILKVENTAKIRGAARSIFGF